MRKIFLILIAILLCATQGWCATYYLREDGTAANKAAATSCAAVGTAMNVTVHDGETFAADDIIILCDEGDPISGFIPPTAGVIYDGYPEGDCDWSTGSCPGVAEIAVAAEGDGIDVNGKDDVTVRDVDIISVADSEALGTGIRWRGDSDNGLVERTRIYCDPSPTATYALYVHGTATNFTVNDSYASYCSYGFIGVGDGGYTANRCVSHHHNVDGFRVPPGNDYSATFNYCLAYSNGDDGFGVRENKNIALNYCVAHDNTENGFMPCAKSSDPAVYDCTGTTVHSCISYSNGDNGFWFYPGTSLTNNVAYDNNIGFNLYCVNAACADLTNTTTLKNNISYENTHATYGDFYVAVTGLEGAGGPYLSDTYNRWYSNARDTVYYQGTGYDKTELAAYQAASGTGTNTTFTDCSMVNPAGSNFRLSALSTCTDAADGTYTLLDPDTTTWPNGVITPCWEMKSVLLVMKIRLQSAATPVFIMLLADQRR